MYVEGENPAMSDPDLNHAARRSRSSSISSSRTCSLTETAFHADVDPARLRLRGESRHLHQHRPPGADRQPGDPPAGRGAPGPLDHPGSRPPHRLDWKYSGPATSSPKWRRLMPSWPISPGSGWSGKARSPIRVDAHDKPGNEIIFGDGFPTESGRAKIVPAAVTPPDEVPDAEFPMVLSTGRVLEHWHTGSMTRRSEVLDAIEPEAVAFMHPVTWAVWRLRAGDSSRNPPRRSGGEACAPIATCRERWSSCPSATPRRRRTY